MTSSPRCGDRPRARLSVGAGESVSRSSRSCAPRWQASRRTSPVAISRRRDRLTVPDEKPVGVDVQSVEGQPWDEIIAAQDHHLADVCVRLTGDQRPYANARIWSARESMKKLAGDALAPLIVDTCGSHRRVTFRSGRHSIATYIMRDRVVAVAKERSA